MEENTEREGLTKKELIFLNMILYFSISLALFLITALFMQLW